MMNVDSLHVSYNLQTKLILAATYYQLGEYDVLISFLHTFNTYLRRKKSELSSEKYDRHQKIHHPAQSNDPNSTKSKRRMGGHLRKTPKRSGSSISSLARGENKRKANLILIDFFHKIKNRRDQDKLPTIKSINRSAFEQEG